MKTFKYITILSLTVFFSYCANTDEEFDANGHFETTEIRVSSENPGRLIEFIVEPGTKLEKNQIVGLVDTMAMSLKKEQTKAQIRAALVKIPGIQAQKDVVSSEIYAIDFELDRIKRLLEDKAATQKQLDDLMHSRDIASARLKTFDNQVNSIGAEAKVMETQIAIINDQISRSLIKSPIDGVVLERFVRESEIVAPGKVLFSIASVKTMELKAYVSGSQLSELEIGQNVTVRIDWEDVGYREYPGVISWISGEAEFTPKIIQTKKERVNLVYAIKINVENDGKIKIGMPGEVIF